MEETLWKDLLPSPERTSTVSMATIDTTSWYLFWENGNSIRLRQIFGCFPVAILKMIACLPISPAKNSWKSISSRCPDHFNNTLHQRGKTGISRLQEKRPYTSGHDDIHDDMITNSIMHDQHSSIALINIFHTMISNLSWHDPWHAWSLISYDHWS